jgi:hypothetical protein
MSRETHMKRPWGEGHILILRISEKGIEVRPVPVL